MIAWLLGMAVAAVSGGEPTLSRFEFSQVEMAVPVNLILYCPDQALASTAARAAFARVHALNSVMSDYDEQSELRRLCATAGEGRAVPVSEDLWKVLANAQEVSAQSEGAFDVTVGPVVRLWRRARRQKELPSPEKIAEARSLVGYKLVRLDAEKRAVELTKPGMRLDLGGIAKGFAMDEALAVLRHEGVARALVEAGGDVRLGDPPPDRPGWRIGLTPLDSPDAITSYLVLSNCAVSTSGDTVQFVEIGGRRYSHIVDPRTGMALTDHSRVTVVARDGLTADGLSKPISILGPEKGFPLVDRTPGAAAMLLRAPQGKVECFESSRWKELPKVPTGGRNALPSVVPGGTRLYPACVSMLSAIAVVAAGVPGDAQPSAKPLRAGIIGQSRGSIVLASPEKVE
jgi:FAD:protein FMN transferase